MRVLEFSDSFIISNKITIKRDFTIIPAASE